jgi:hypothetical protein
VKEGSSLQATEGVESASSATPETWTGRLQLKVRWEIERRMVQCI